MKKRLINIYIFLTIIIFFGCSAIKKNETITSQQKDIDTVNFIYSEELRTTFSPDNDEMRIYNVILDDEITQYLQYMKNYRNEERSNGILLINENLDFTQDEAVQATEYFRKEISNVEESLLVSFINNNSTYYAFDRITFFNITFYWYNYFFNSVGIDNSRANFHRNGRSLSFNRIIEVLPDFASIITFSRIGFNDSKNKAVLYLISNGVGSCGGEYVFLEKKNNEWRIIRWLIAWIQ